MPFAFCSCVTRTEWLTWILLALCTLPVRAAFCPLQLQYSCLLTLPLPVVAAQQVPLSSVLRPLQYDYMSARLISISYLLRYPCSLSQSIIHSLPSDYVPYISVPPIEYLHAVIYHNDTMHHVLQSVFSWQIQSLTVAAVTSPHPFFFTSGRGIC